MLLMPDVSMIEHENGYQFIHRRSIMEGAIFCCDIIRHSFRQETLK